MRHDKRPRSFWPALLNDAAAIVSARGSTTLRQLHYLLASDNDNDYRNNSADYGQLSARTAKARREGWFPTLYEYGRDLHRRGGYASVGEALGEAASRYRRDYMDGQKTEVWIVVEKDTVLDMARRWAAPYGIPYASLSGFGSQTIMDEIAATAGTFIDKAEEVVALYVGDFDPSGLSIERDFLTKCGGSFDEVVRVAVTGEQVDEYDLPPAPGKIGDSRSAGFVAEHGSLFQVEVEAFEVFHPETLAELVDDAIRPHVDLAQLGVVRDSEKNQQRRLYEFMRYGGFDDFDETQL